MTETTYETENKVDDSAPKPVKKKHRWYHWATLVLFALISVFNGFEALIISGGQMSLLNANIAAFFGGGGEKNLARDASR